MKGSNNAKVYALISAVLCSVFALLEIILTTTAVIMRSFPTQLLVFLIFSSFLLIFLAAALFFQNELCIAFCAGAFVVFFIYLMIQLSGNYGDVNVRFLFKLLAYLALLALAIMSYNDVPATRHLWFLPGVLLLFGHVIVWFATNQRHLLMYYYPQMRAAIILVLVWFALVEIAVITFASAFLCQDIPAARSRYAYPPYLEDPYAPYAPYPQDADEAEQEFAYAPAQRPAYAPYPRDAYAPYPPDAYARYSQNACAPYRPPASAPYRQPAYAPSQQPASAPEQPNDFAPQDPNGSAE